MSVDLKRIAISTGGGDAPGLNAVIRAATLAARNRGWDVVGIRDGFNGLMHPERYPQGGLVPLTRETVRGIVHQGGTIIGTTNRGNPTAYPVQDDDGTWTEIDRTDELVGLFGAHDIDALITVGGDGSLTIGARLYEAGLRVIGVPKTIDNDLDKTTSTFGFDTAVSFASDCIDRLFSTATSHGRILVVEVMGRYAGWIAACAGVASGAHAILIPEIPFTLEPVAATIAQREERGAKFSIVVVAEGAAPAGRSGLGARQGRRAGREARRYRAPSSPRGLNGSPARKPESSSSDTCCGAGRRPRSTGCSASASALPPCVASRRATTV